MNIETNDKIKITKEIVNTIDKETKRLEKQNKKLTIADIKQILEVTKLTIVTVAIEKVIEDLEKGEDNEAHNDKK